MGAGQMSRVDASRIAVWKAGEADLPLAGSVVCSDAFFPFPDGLDRGGGRGRDGGDSAGRLGAGRGSDRGGGRARDGDGVHRHAAFPALKFCFTQKMQRRKGFLIHADAAPVNQGDLGGGDGGDERPDEKFAPAQAALPGGGEPELQFGGAKRDGVAVAEHLILKRRAVDGGQGARRDREMETAVLQFEREVPVPDAIVFKLQMVFRRASDAERKMADNRLAARLFSRKDVELNHQKIRCSTLIWSSG